MAAKANSGSDYSPLFTSGLYYPNASRRHMHQSSFLDVDSPSESDTDASMASFMRPHGRSPSPAPTVRPPVRAPPQHRSGIPPAPPAPSHAPPSVPSSSRRPNGTSPHPPMPAQRPMMPAAHSRHPTSGSAAPPSDPRTAALARLEGRPAAPQPAARPRQQGQAQPTQAGSFLPLGAPPASSGRMRTPVPSGSRA